MSKVKNGYKNAHEKSKLRRNLRRKETAYKKRDRINKANNNVYSYPCGYYIKDEKRINEYILVDVPETTVNVYDCSFERQIHYEIIDGELYEHEVAVPVHKIIGKKTIPAHKKRKWIGCYYKDVPEIPRRINVTKKYYKKTSNRKVRYSKDNYKRGDYKKVFDLWWSLC